MDPTEGKSLNKTNMWGICLFDRILQVGQILCFNTHLSIAPQSKDLGEAMRQGCNIYITSRDCDVEGVRGSQTVFWSPKITGLILGHCYVQRIVTWPVGQSQGRRVPVCPCARPVIGQLCQVSLSSQLPEALSSEICWDGVSYKACCKKYSHTTGGSTKPKRSPFRGVSGTPKGCSERESIRLISGNSGWWKIISRQIALVFSFSFELQVAPPVLTLTMATLHLRPRIPKHPAL